MKNKHMKDSSILSFRGFDYITFGSVFYLLRLIFSSSTQKIDFHYLQSKHRTLYSDFSDSLSFLQLIKWISIDDHTQTVHKSVNFPVLEESDIKKSLRQVILSEPYRELLEVDRFFENFILVENTFSFYPTQTLRLRTSGIRNFLISIELIDYNELNGSYFVVDSISKSVFNFFNQNRLLSPKALANKLNSLETLGKAAELEVVSYEHDRLKKFLGNIPEIKHVSLFQVNAGYDIHSFTVESSGIIDRFIEVKAVPINNKKFFWSRNEIETAKYLGKRYYLYLVPVISKDIFDMSKIEIICDPYVAIKVKKTYKSQIELESFTRV